MQATVIVTFLLTARMAAVVDLCQHSVYIDMTMCCSKKVAIRDYTTTDGQVSRWGACKKCGTRYCSRDHVLVKGSFEWAAREDKWGVHWTQVCITGDCPIDNFQTICCGERVALHPTKTLTGEIIRAGRCKTCLKYYCARGHVMDDWLIAWAYTKNVKGEIKSVAICVTNECGIDHFKVWPERLGLQ